MVTVAQVVEHVSITTYLDAVHLVQDPCIQTAAATIVTVESRHSAVLNIFESAMAISQLFDLAFLPNEVLAIAGSVISGCDLGIAGTLFQCFIIFFPSELTAFSFPLQSADPAFKLTLAPSPQNQIVLKIWHTTLGANWSGTSAGQWPCFTNSWYICYRQVAVSLVVRVHRSGLP